MGLYMDPDRPDYLPMSINAETGYKSMTVAKLREILSRIDGELRVGPNAVGNLMVTRAEDGEGDYLGYVDFNEETLELDNG